jgi:hypothetical protein
MIQVTSRSCRAAQGTQELIKKAMKEQAGSNAGGVPAQHRSHAGVPCTGRPGTLLEFLTGLLVRMATDGFTT